MRPLTHFSLSKSLPRHLLQTVTTVTPLQYLNYFQCLIFLYFFCFTVYYHDKYSKIDNCHVASAILDKNSMELTMVFLFDKEGSRNDLFFVDSSDNETKMELKKPGLVENKHIMLWSSEISNSDRIYIHAEHPKGLRLEREIGRPLLEVHCFEISKRYQEIQIFPQEPYQESHDVVTCMTPVSHDLELLLTALTSSISMGSFVNLPYSQMPGELYKFLRIFEKSGNLRLSAHPLLRKFPENQKNHLKNQKIQSDLAQLYCYLMYHSKSKFLIFQNSLDTVIPVSKVPNGEVLNYFSEFSSIFRMPRVDGYGVLEYNARIQVQKTSSDFSDFSVQSALGNAKIEVFNGGAKNFVVKTNTQNTNMFNKRGKLYSPRNSASETTISPKIMESIDKIIDIAEESDIFWTLLKSCSEQKSWRCSSAKCIRPAIRHRTLQGYYSYDIHFSQFIRVDSFDC